MKRLRLWGLAALVPACALLLNGCGSKDTGAAGGGDGKSVGEVKTPTGEAKPVKGDGTGTLKGKVTLAGTRPTSAPQNIPPDNKDKKYCEMAPEDQKVNQQWRVGSNGGVEDVVVFVSAPSGSYFELTDEQKKPEKDKVVIDQPYCAFVPHVAVTFPSYWDPKAKKVQMTGQKLEVANSAQVTHNTNLQPSLPTNSGSNKILAPKTPPGEVTIKTGGRPGQFDHTTLTCNIHTWMKAHVWAFDHPFAATTDKDGNFTIKNVPAGADVEIYYWHESMDKPQKLKTAKLTMGDNTADIELKK